MLNYGLDKGLKEAKVTLQVQDMAKEAVVTSFIRDSAAKLEASRQTQDLDLAKEKARVVLADQQAQLIHLRSETHLDGQNRRAVELCNTSSSSSGLLAPLLAIGGGVLKRSLAEMLATSTDEAMASFYGIDKDIKK